MVVSKLFWPLMYTVSAALTCFFLVAGVTYWNWEIGAYAGAGGAVFGFLGYLLIRYGPKRRDPLNAFMIAATQEFERAIKTGWMWRNQAESAGVLLTRTLAYLAHKPFDSITVRELYDDIQKHLAEVEEEDRGREEDS